MSGSETVGPAAERMVEIGDEDTAGGEAPVEPSAGDRPAGADGAAGPDWQAERRVLIDLLIYAWDRAKSPGVCERLALGLEQVGVSVLRPDAELFDPARHEVGAVEPTADESLHDRIAETELAGFSDRGRLIREPIVVVYRRG